MYFFIYLICLFLIVTLGLRSRKSEEILNVHFIEMEDSMHTAHALDRRIEHLPSIVFTGGPCSGKTTALAHVTEWLRGRSYRVYIMPETATLLIKGAFPDLAKLALDEYPHFLAVQKQILALQMAFLRSFREVGRAFAGQPQVIICDRGMMDSLAYVRERRDFIEILRALHLPQREARDSFDGVIHLVTAADGAEEFYTLANNIARSETPEQARELDSRTQAAWLGHPHLKVIDNSTAFDLKMHRTIQAVTRILGIPVPLEIERKFLVELPIDWSHPVLASAALVEIEQQYVRLYGTDQVARIRRRGQRGSWTYTQTSKERQSALTRTEIEHRITREEYDALSLYRLASTRLIRKHRHCFIWESQYFELDVFSDLPELALLEIELTEEHDKVTIPPFLKTSREVTEDPSYENRTLATIRL